MTELGEMNKEIETLEQDNGISINHLELAKKTSKKDRIHFVCGECNSDKLKERLREALQFQISDRTSLSKVQAIIENAKKTLIAELTPPITTNQFIALLRAEEAIQEQLVHKAYIMNNYLQPKHKKAEGLRVGRLTNEQAALSSAETGRAAELDGIALNVDLKSGAAPAGAGYAAASVLRSVGLGAGSAAEVLSPRPPSQLSSQKPSQEPKILEEDKNTFMAMFSNAALQFDRAFGDTKLPENPEDSFNYPQVIVNYLVGRDASFINATLIEDAMIWCAQKDQPYREKYAPNVSVSLNRLLGSENNQTNQEWLKWYFSENKCGLKIAILNKLIKDKQFDSYKESLKQVLAAL